MLPTNEVRMNCIRFWPQPQDLPKRLASSWMKSMVRWKGGRPKGGVRAQARRVRAKMETRKSTAWKDHSEDTLVSREFSPFWKDTRVKHSIRSYALPTRIPTNKSGI